MLLKYARNPTTAKSAGSATRWSGRVLAPGVPTAETGVYDSLVHIRARPKRWAAATLWSLGTRVGRLCYGRAIVKQLRRGVRRDVCRPSPGSGRKTRGAWALRLHLFNDGVVCIPGGDLPGGKEQICLRTGDVQRHKPGDGRVRQHDAGKRGLRRGVRKNKMGRRLLHGVSKVTSSPLYWPTSTAPPGTWTW